MYVKKDQETVVRTCSRFHKCTGVYCTRVHKGQQGQYQHAIFRAPGAAAAAAGRPGVLHFLQRPPLWWPVSAHCHPDSTSVNMLKPLLLLNSSKPEEMNASSSAPKLKIRAYVWQLGSHSRCCNVTRNICFSRISTHCTLFNPSALFLMQLE